MADVFISYHRSDGASALVRRIAGELESRGISCWYDTKNATPIDFVKRIVTEIESCKVFLFIWDEQANEDSKQANSYVRSEIQCAYGEKHIALFPFQVGKFEQNKTLKFYFAHINIPYGGDTPETAQTTELVNAISDVLGKTQPPPIIMQMLLPNLDFKPQPTPPVKIIKSGECGKNVVYTLDENGVLTISGNGTMWDFTLDETTYAIFDTPWRNERGKISLIKIRHGVTKIGRGAFDECTGLVSVSIPDSVVSIGSWAFDNCWYLKRIIIPDSVTYIGISAFENCKELTSVNIPDSVVSIGDWAFNGCWDLRSVSIPTKTKVGEWAFDDTVRVIRRKSADNQ